MKKLFTIVLLALGLNHITIAQTVTLDYYFNHETHTTKTGEKQRFHYLWDDYDNTGFSIWGDDFKSLGVKLDTLGTAPTVRNLKKSDIYIIVDPDSKKESAAPNYVTHQDADEIAKWVDAGGVLVLMANDSANVELKHFNILAAKFGMHFNDDLQNHVIDDAHFSDGAVYPKNSDIFKTCKKAFLKDVCSISLPAAGKPVLTATNNGAVIAAVVKYGRGTVFAVGDPWLYNEYVNGRLPSGFENDKAANDLAKWLLAQVPATKR